MIEHDAQRSAFNVASALKAFINVYQTLFFIILALQSEVIGVINC
jgi:hypothetical protein